MSNGLSTKSYAAFVRDACAQLEEMAACKSATRAVYLQNGKLLESTRESGYEYSFFIDPELYLPEGIDVTWQGGKRRVKGSIVYRNGDYVEISFEDKLDGDLSDTRISTGLPDFLRILKQRLEESGRKQQIPLAQRLIVAARQGSSNEIEWATSSRDYASEILSRDLAFVWGPPGTGKTFTLAEVAARLVLSGKRVLMVSNTNVAVDQAIIELDRRLKGKGKTVLRFGVAKDKRIVGNDKLSSYERALSSKKGLREKRDSLINKRKKADARTRLMINRQLADLRNETRRQEERLIRTASYVGTTVAKATMDPVIYTFSYDAVLFDEAGMALIPQIAFAASLATSHFACFGDFRQLPPIVEKDVAQSLDTDVYEWVGITAAVERHKGHKLLVAMSEQHRSHAKIAEFVSTHLYMDRLTTAPDALQKTELIAEAEPLPGEPIVLIDTSGYPTRSLVEPKITKSYSHYNVFHAFLAVQVSLIAKRDCTNDYDGEDLVAIVVPYATQARLIRGILRSLGSEATGIRCSTIHGFQGSSAQVVVFDTVDAHTKKYELGYPLSYNEHRKADRLINVALTRARGKVIVIADMGSMARSLGYNSGLILRDLLDEVSKPQTCISGDTLQATVLSQETALQHLEADRALSRLIKDINTAQESVMLNVPAAFYSNINSLVLSVLRDASNRGVKVVARGDIYLINKIATMPSANAMRTDAFHALCVVDGKIVYCCPSLFGGQTKAGMCLEANCSWRIESKEVAKFIEKRVLNRPEKRE